MGDFTCDSPQAKEPSMNTLRLLAASIVTLTVGCATDPEPPPAPGDTAAYVEGSADDAVARPGPTVLDLQRPASSIADGSHVVLDHAALRVTAQAGRSLWVQEAGASGACDDDSADRVAFRAIRIELTTGDHAYRPGEQVRIEGEVMTIAGRRRIVDAHATSIAMAAPYQAYCDRDATLFADPAFEGVLVETAGRAMGEDAGAWGLRSCFAGAAVTRIEQPMRPGQPIDGTWRRVTGVVQQGADMVIQPRTNDDVIEGGSDVCL